MSAARLRVIETVDATWTASSAAPTLPPSHLALPSRGRLWRATGCAAETVVADLGTAQAIGAAALVDANLTAGATVTLEGNAVDAWPGAYGPTAVPLWDAGASGVVPLYLPGAETYRFWRWSFVDPGNPTGYIQVGKLVLGPVWDLGAGPLPPDLPLVDPSLLDWAPSGAPYAYALPIYRALTLPLLLETAAAVADFEALLRRVGTTRDVVLSLYADPGGDAAAIAGNLYARLARLPQGLTNDPPFWRATLDVREAR